MPVKLDIAELTEDDDFLQFLKDCKRTPRTLDVCGTIPESDFKHLSEKITYPLSWWTAARIEARKFRKEFDLKNSLFFINCSGLIVGFFYPSEGNRIGYNYAEKWGGDQWHVYDGTSRHLYLPDEVEKDPRTITLPRTWCCVIPVPIADVFGYDKNNNPKSMQGLKTMPNHELFVLEQKESWKRVESWRKDIRINPKSGRWYREDYRLKEQRDNQ